MTLIVSSNSEINFFKTLKLPVKNIHSSGFAAKCLGDFCMCLVDLNKLNIIGNCKFSINHATWT